MELPFKRQGSSEQLETLTESEKLAGQILERLKALNEERIELINHGASESAIKPIEAEISRLRAERGHILDN